MSLMTLLVAVLSGLLVSACNGATPGPLRGDDILGGGGVSGMQVDTPQVVAFGYNVLEDPVSEPITDIRATLVDRSQTSLVTVPYGTRILELTGDIGPTAVAKWPGPDIPVAKTVDAAGYVLRPRIKAELIVLISARGSGKVTWKALRVEYRFRSKRYVTTLGSGFGICAPTSIACP